MEAARRDQVALDGGAEPTRACPSGHGASEPFSASTAVRSSKCDGRSGGMAAILLVSSEQILANSSGVRYARLLCGRSSLYNQQTQNP